MNRTMSDRNEPQSRRPRRARRRGSHLRSALGWWARTSLLVLAIGVLGLAAFGLVAKIIRPYREANQQRHQLDATEGQIASLRQENAALAHRIAYLKTPSGVSGEARKLGYVRPGEIPIVVEGVTLPAADSDALSGTEPTFTPVLGKPAPSLSERARRLWRHLKL